MRTHYCTDLTSDMLTDVVTICGWVDSRRNHGGLIFSNVRDQSGIMQVVFQPEEADIFKVAETLHREDVIKVAGIIRSRPDGMVNANLKTGSIEILATSLTILNRTEVPPFLPDEKQNVYEDLRYRYRYLDLRREKFQHNLTLRHHLTRAIRDYLNQRRFLDIETPMLTKATPEGARDYLVPSRVHAGRFYALPQSPQLFKQLLMMSGFDKYYQVVRCFRDEDLRADRQPEFTQLDVEMAFVDEETVIGLMEGLLKHVFREVIGVELPDVLPRMTYAEAMKRFGSDKPDLRNPLELVDIEDIVQDSQFSVFSKAASDTQSRVVALKLSGGCDLSRKALDDYGKFVGIYGAKGLAYLKVNDRTQGMEGLQSPILKFLSETEVQSILERTSAETGDVIFFGSDKIKVVNEAMGALRVKLGQDRGLIESGWRLLWVIDWPMFERDEETKQLHAMHHPFTSPQQTSPEALKGDPEHMLAKAYDIVINGYEIGGGSVRIHQTTLQKTVFELLGISDEEANDKFGFLLEALQYGCPPHGGIALGLDRLAMLLVGATSIRDVIAFPKTQSASCLLTEAPSSVSETDLATLGIALSKPKQA